MPNAKEVKIDDGDRRILRILQEDGRITNQDLARRCGLTPRAFANACRSHLGLSPSVAFRHARCSAAAALLAQGASVAETAARFGFANPFHFSRAFRQAMGTAPSEWRR